jgi:colanic acid/amylovoran biosynthesis glycosyltransferase
MHTPRKSRPVALQRCDQFVGRTMNWLYDHLRSVPRHEPVVLCDTLANREEFPELRARVCDQWSIGRRIWRRLAGVRPFPPDASWLRSIRPQVLHSHFGYVAHGDLSLHEHLEVPWIVGFYGADVYQLGRLPEWQARYARLFERVSTVLALGPAMARQLEIIGCPKEKIAIHPLGVDVGVIPYRPRNYGAGETLKLLFAGTFREKKGILYAIEGIAKALRSGVELELHLVGGAMNKPGDKEQEQAIFARIRELDMERVIHLKPFLSFRELLELAFDSHVFVAPSVVAEDGDSEGTPFVLQQMMASGMTAIATSHSDIPFLFGEHEGLLVPERDADSIAERLVRYSREPETVAEDGARLGQRIRNALDVRDCSARLSDLYDRLA